MHMQARTAVDACERMLVTLVVRTMVDVDAVDGDVVGRHAW
jgi:hypothetical protein